MVEELMLALRVGREKLPRLDGMTETAQTTASNHSSAHPSLANW